MKNLYLDIDGVIRTYVPGAGFTLAKGAVQFLEWAVRHFNCRWLSCWTHDADNIGYMHDRVFTDAFTDNLPTLNKIEVAEWAELKTEGIDSEGDFFWIEDGIHPQEEEVLRRKGKTESYIYCNTYRYPLDLVRVHGNLREIIDLEKNHEKRR